MKKSLFWPTLLTLLGFCILCTLGTWQLHRLEWKIGLITALDAEYAKDAAATLLTTDDLKDNPLFRRGTLRGVYAYDKQFLLGPRVYDNLPGRHVITPLQLEDGTWILVNRGWVSQSWNFAEEKDRSPGATISVTGLLRRPDDNPFAPPNVPEKDQWYSINIDQVAASKNIGSTVHPYMLYQEGIDSTNYPIAAATKPELMNNHLQYAFFWFAMAGALLIIYALRFLKKDKTHV